MYRVEREVAICVDAELLDDVIGAVAARQLDDIGLAVDGLEDGVARVALHQPGDVLVRYRVPYLARNEVDELLPGQDARDVLVVEDPRRCRAGRERRR